MSKSKAEVAKKATGLVFFSLLDSDNVIECNDPCHNFVPIDEVADPSTTDTFIEVYDNEPEIVEEMPAQKPVFEIFEFKDIDVCGDCDGLILAASVDAESGVIFFQKENQPSFKERSLVIEEERPCYVDVDDDFIEPKEYDSLFFKHKMRCQNWGDWRHRKGEEHKPIRNNRKTLLDRKVQRDNRSTLREIKFTSFDEENFYEEEFFFINDALDFDTEDDDYDYFLSDIA